MFKFVIKTIWSESGFSEGYKGSISPGPGSKYDNPRPLLKDGKNWGNNSSIIGEKVDREEKEKKTKECKKINQALVLPSIHNINSRTIYNKKNEFETLVKEEELNCIFMSESFEREEKTLNNLIKLDDHVVEAIWCILTPKTYKMIQKSKI